ncbi:MAG: hypothetical protein P8Y58_13375 [Novosphingobium sp.]
MDGGRSQAVRIIGAAAMADPQLQDAGMLAVLRGPMASGAMAGRRFTASTAGRGAEHGILVPRSALMRWQGQLWAYREQSNGTFRRIVIDGATTLFAVERGGSAPQDDD